MNREQRRENRRRVLAALRDSGCRCSPHITADQAAEPGTRETGSITHEEGCPLWDRLLVAYLAGHRPMLVVDAAPGCSR